MQTAAILPQLATTAAPARTLGSDSRAFAPAMEQASSAIGQKGQRASDSGSDLAGAVNAQAEKSTFSHFRERIRNRNRSR